MSDTPALAHTTHATVFFVGAASLSFYRRSTRAAIVARGRDAGDALGTDPAAAVAEIAARVLPLVNTQKGSDGRHATRRTCRRVFELAVHTTDLARALGASPEVPATAAAQALDLVADLTIDDGHAVPLLLAATGRPGPPAGFSVL